MTQSPDIIAAINRILKYGRRGPWVARREERTHEVLGTIFERFDLDGENLCFELEQLHVLDAFEALGVEDALCTQLASGQGGLIDEYLKRRGFQETPRARRYLQALRTTRVRLYEVTEVEPGAWVEVRDALSGGAVQRVIHPTWSVQMMRGDRIAARILNHENELMFSNALLRLDQQVGERCQRTLERARDATAGELESLAKDAGIDASVLARIGDESFTAVGTAVLQFWLTQLLEDTDGLLPDIDADAAGETDSDDEPLLSCTGSMTFDPADEPTIVQRLDALPGWERSATGGMHWLWRTEPDSPDPTDPDEFLAEVSLEVDELVVATDSEELLDRTLAVLQPTLDGLVGETFVMCGEIEEPVDAADALRRIKNEGYRLLLDERLPMFDDHTPRQYAKTPAGRAAVMAWLRSLEEMERREASVICIEAHDLRWMWRELGLRDAS